MKSKFLSFIELAMLTLLTLLMIYDFFPKLISFLYIPKAILIGLLLLIFLIAIFASHPQKGDFSKSDLVWQVVFLSYLFALIIIFTLAGGISQVGISLTSPFLWIVFFISILDIVKGYKKVRVNQLHSGN